jgi:prepilin-type N-terminal cleavage/methylation domain-containing protein
MRRRQQGFTIVELLIVIVVIAILAAITIVAYNGIQNRARLSAASQALSQGQKKIAAWGVVNADVLPTNLSQVDAAMFASGWSYGRFDNNRQYCLSTTVNATTYFIRTTQPTQVQQGSCTDATAIEGAGNPIAILNGAQSVASLSTPLIGAPDITIYAVFDVVDTATSWDSIMQLRPSVTNHIFQLDTAAAGSETLRYRMDSAATSNATASRGGVRTAGRHIGWLQVGSGATVRQFNYDAAPTANVSSFDAGTNWNYTSAALGGSASTQPIVGLVYNAAHNEATRARVMQWLANNYNMNSTY